MLNRNKLSHKINYEVLQGLFGSTDAAAGGEGGSSGRERRQSPGAAQTRASLSHPPDSLLP